MGKQINTLLRNYKIDLATLYINDHWMVSSKTLFNVEIGNPRWPPQQVKFIFHRILLEKYFKIILMNLNLNHLIANNQYVPWMVLYQMCAFCIDREIRLNYGSPGKEDLLNYCIF